MVRHPSSVRNGCAVTLLGLVITRCYKNAAACALTTTAAGSGESGTEQAAAAGKQ